MMKRISLYFPVLAVLFTLLTGCDKESTVLPPREISEEVQVIADRYNEILGSTDKWMLAYKPENYEDSVYIQLQFAEEGKVDILSGYRDFHTVQSKAAYAFEGKFTPIITFGDNTVFGALADLYNGSVKFKINYMEDGSYFELTRSDGYDDTIFKLIKMNATYEEKLTDQINAVLDQIAYEEEQARLSAEVRQKVKDFVEIESDFYFYNLTVEDFSAAINSFDTTARTISLTYKETPTSAPTDVTVGYTLTAEGIVLNPAVAYGDVSIDVIGLGDFNYENPDNSTEPTSIEIVSAGSAGAGTMGYMHVAPYPYTKVADRSQTSVDWIIDEMYRTPSTLPSNQWNLLYTNSSSLYSEKASVAVADFKTWLAQNILDYNPTGAATFNIQFHMLNNRLSFGILLPAPVGYRGYDIAYRKSNDHGSVMFMDVVSDRTGTHNAEIVREGLDTFMRTLFPEEGFTVVPVLSAPGSSSHRVHLVSRKDSRVWGEFRFQTAAMYNIQHN